MSTRQAVLCLELKELGEWASIKKITDWLRTPTHFIAKTLQDLTKKNILLSLRGPTGGFALARPFVSLRGVFPGESCI